MSVAGKLTVKEIVDKIRQMANTEYDGLIHDYIVTIFNRLSLNERKILLRGLIDITTVIDPRLPGSEKASDDPNAPKPVDDVKTEAEEKSKAADENEKELIKLKTWLVKAATYFALGILILLIILVLFVPDSGNKATPSFVTTVAKYVKLVFGL